MERELTEQEILEIKKEFEDIPKVDYCSIDKVRYTRINVEMIRGTTHEERSVVYKKEQEIHDKYADVSLEFNTFGG